MAAKSKTCTCGQSDTPANSSVDKNKKKVERLIDVIKMRKNAVCQKTIKRLKYRKIPHEIFTITTKILRAKETGSLLRDMRNYGPPVRHNVGREEEVLRMFDENPGTSVRRAVRALGLSQCMMHRILRRNHLRPYHYQRAAIAGISPHFLPPRLSAQAYGEFLENDLLVLFEDVPLHNRQTLIYQHDGAPAHFSRRTKQILDARFPERWMGRGGPIIWLAKSPDLNMLDYFVWGHIKNLIEHRRNGLEHEVRDEIMTTFNTITPDGATRQIVRRIELCSQARGRHLEQLLH
ncbi:hypothetical protein ALC53_09121 [Atta colombica]|uniref:Tc1-like transposase DDE domain-containing protein n=1 Tax=Atta colombica TaxID=520822 RepID=A0A151I1Z9_9HYME|nr:hypothetical protein ALC53_09121 [Atta colombica]